MHSQNNKASWRHLRKASRKSLPCMLAVERTKTITKLVFSSGVALSSTLTTELIDLAMVGRLGTLAVAAWIIDL